MILNAKQTMVAYWCPSCGKAVKSMVGVFSLSGNLLRLKCECGGSELTAHIADGQVRLTIPCLFCPNPHNFTVSSSLFFGDKAFLLPCPMSGYDIGFLGSEASVDKALQNSEEELFAMMDENGVDSLDPFRSQDEPFDSMLFSTMEYLLMDLQEEGDIRCSCGHNGIYSIEKTGEHQLHLFCEKCGDGKLLTVNQLTIDALMDADELVLEPDPEESGPET